MDSFQNLSFLDIYAGFFGSQVAIAPEYLAITLLIAFVIYKLRHIRSGFWAWVIPKSIYRHSSSILDIKLFVAGQLMALLGLVNKVTVTTIIASTVAALFTVNITSKALANPLLIAGIVVVLNDFVAYWLHRFYHQTPIAWPIHSLHHSAEVLTPVTTFRHHPAAILISTFVHSIIFGLFQGLLLGMFVAKYKYTQIAGINAFYFVFLMLVNNFYHSHIWVNFGPLWGRVFISPAQHQIHHSLAPHHHNKNYGQFLAVWDWMFGTLYIPQGYEKISVGIADPKGNKLPQKHTSLTRAVIVPIREIWQQILPKHQGNPEK